MTRTDVVLVVGRRLVTGALFGAALALSVSGLAHPAIAGARNTVGMNWDTYFDCMRKDKSNSVQVAVELCCIQSGGVVVADRETGDDVSCWDHVPTPEECKTVIGPNCTRQLPPVKVDPSMPPVDIQPADPGTAEPPTSPPRFRGDIPSVTSVTLS